MLAFLNFESYQERYRLRCPSWYLAEKYYNCEEGWHILKNFLR